MMVVGLRHRFTRPRGWRFALLVIALGCLLSMGAGSAHASSGINSQLNFQARLLTSSGATVPDGSYNIQFKIYQDGTGCVSSGSSPCGGTLKWTESWLNVNTQGVAVTNGYFSVQLGSITSFTSSVDWNQDTLWLSLNVGDTNASCASFASCSPDGEMLPFKRLTATPYALNAAKVGGIAAASLVQLSPSGAQTGDINITGSFAALSASIAAAAKPSANQLSISNAGYGVDTSNVNGLAINYVGGSLTSGSLESSGARIDLTPGGTSGNTWNGLRVVMNATGPASGVNANGIKLDGPTSPGSGTATGLKIGSGWDVGLDIQSGGLNLATVTSDPATPATDNAKLFMRKIAGRPFLRVLGSDGVAYNTQPAIYDRQILTVSPSSGSTLLPSGGTVSTTGTLTSPTPTEAYGYTSNFATAATANTSTGYNTSMQQFFRGSTTGSSGFFYFIRIGMPDADYGSTSTGARLFMGLSSTGVAGMTNSDTPAGNFAGFQYSTTRPDTNWQLITKNGTTQTTTDTTIAVGAAGQQNAMYDMYMYCVSQCTTLYWRVDNLTSGASQSGSTSSNLPTGSTAMYSLTALQTLTTTARNFRLQKNYVEVAR